VTGTTREFDRLSDLTREVTLARIYGGLQFREAMQDGERLERALKQKKTRAGALWRLSEQPEQGGAPRGSATVSDRRRPASTGSG
jgi:hypothetical protein